MWQNMLRYFLRLSSPPSTPTVGVEEPQQTDEYQQAMARAREAQFRAEQIMAEVRGTKGSKQTRPA